MDDNIKTYLPENFYVNLNPKAFNAGMMVAINDMASYYASMIEDAISQQFVSSATGKYLIYLGEQGGFSLPPNSGLDITALQILIPAVISSPKQVYSTLERFVNAFYTDFKTRPSFVCSVPGPYSLTDGDTLILESPSGQEIITVLASVVSDITNVDPSELASIINVSQTSISADTFTDVASGNRYLRLASQTSGVGAFLRVIGGSVQNVLQFPLLRGSNFFAGTSFLAAKVEPYSDMVRLVWDGVGTDPSLFKVEVGDNLTIRGLQDGIKVPSSLLNGTYQVSKSGYNYLEFKEVRSSLAGAPGYYAKQDAQFSISGSLVSVFWIGHGLANGDSITGICNVGTGGLSAAQLSFIGLPVTVIDPDNFTVTLTVSAISPGDGTYFAIGLSASVPEDNSILVTDQKKMRIYDQSEYAYVSEAISGDCKVLVPAVPPISRRFLQGSAHLHGQKFPVLDFTRSSLTLDTSKIDGSISDPDSFVLTNSDIRPDFSIPNIYPSLSETALNSSTTVFSIGDVDGNGIFPYTADQSIGIDSIYGVPGSDALVLSFPFRHGLKKNWQLTLTVSSGSGNFLTSQLNGNFVVGQVLNDNEVSISVLDPTGAPIPYQGLQASGFDVYQVATPRFDSSDFYLEFPVLTDPTTLGFAPGSIFAVNKSIGTNVVSTYAKQIRQFNYVVTTIESNLVYFNVGVGAGPFGLIISSAECGISGNFGGDCSYFFDKTSPHNLSEVMSGLLAIQTNAQLSANSGYVGSYLFDPAGKVFPYTISGTNTPILDIVLKGSSPSALFVNSVDSWPETGYIYLSYGSSNQEGPVSFYSTISVTGNSQVLVDPSYIFKFTHKVGELAHLLSARSPFVPATDGSDYPVYLTGTAAARDTLEALLKDTIACGIVLDWNVLLPSLRYVDPSIAPYGDTTYNSVPAGVVVGQLPTVI